MPWPVIAALTCFHTVSPFSPVIQTYYDGADFSRSHRAAISLLRLQRLPRDLTRSSYVPVQFLSAPKHLCLFPTEKPHALSRHEFRLYFPEPRLLGIRPHCPADTPPRTNFPPAVASAEKHGFKPRPQALLPPASRRSESPTSGNHTRWHRHEGFPRSDNP